MIKVGVTVVTCDGEDLLGEATCSEYMVFDRETHTEMRQALLDRAWTIDFNRQLCSIHGHQAQIRRESDAKDGSSQEEDIRT
jgi:hypothetical protein